MTRSTVSGSLRSGLLATKAASVTLERSVLHSNFYGLVIGDGGSVTEHANAVWGNDQNRHDEEGLYVPPAPEPAGEVLEEPPREEETR